jgi:Flp pilus assembly protein TadB
LKDTKDRPSELRPLALMLTNQLTEQQRQEAEIQTQTVKLREEVKRSEQYKQKLDALVETERKMLERSKPARNP